jgi:hypothetical protein
VVAALAATVHAAARKLPAATTAAAQTASPWRESGRDGLRR